MDSSVAFQTKGRPLRSLIAEFSAISLLFVATGTIGIQLDLPGTVGSPFWPPSGVGLAAYVLRGRSALPAIGVGAVAVDIMSFGMLPATTLALDAAGAMVEPFVAIWVMSRLSADPPFSFRTTRGVLAAWAGMMAGTLLATGLGLLGFMTSGFLPASDLPFSALTWWVGNTTGMMVIAPALLVWHREPMPRPVLSRPFEAVILMVLLPAVAGLAYAADLLPVAEPFRLVEVMGVPVVLAATYRFMIHGTVTAIAATSMAALVIGVMVLMGADTPQPDTALLRLQMFVAVVGLTGHLLISQITIRARAEGELRQALAEAKDANMAKTMFLARMSHELRTPLNAILGFSEVIDLRSLGETPAAQEKYRAYTHDIHLSGEHLMKLINDILDVSRIEANAQVLTEQPLDVRHEIDDCLAMLRDHAHHAGVAITADLPSDLPLLRADSRSLRQILINVVGNAIKFTGPGGTVRLGCRAGAADGLSITVSDTGMGMTPDSLAHLFEPFRRGNPHISSKRTEGTGLGLAICNGLMELHQGRIAVDSRPGAGTTVTVWFPPERCEFLSR